MSEWEQEASLLPGGFSTQRGGILVQATSSQLDHIDAEKAESTLKLVVLWPPKKLADPEAVAEAVAVASSSSSSDSSAASSSSSSDDDGGCKQKTSSILGWRTYYRSMKPEIADKQKSMKALMKKRERFADILPLLAVAQRTGFCKRDREALGAFQRNMCKKRLQNN